VALDRSGRCGVAHWTMRKKAYSGVLSLHAGHVMLIALHHAEEVVALEEFEAPTGPTLAEREIEMARQLIGMLAASFDPNAYHDEYRERVLELIRAKASGAVLRFERRQRGRRPTEDLTEALEASLERRRA
jgi:DNA end-binding protein Ku